MMSRQPSENSFIRPRKNMHENSSLLSVLHTILPRHEKRFECSDDGHPIRIVKLRVRNQIATVTIQTCADGTVTQQAQRWKSNHEGPYQDGAREEANVPTRSLLEWLQRLQLFLVQMFEWQVNIADELWRRLRQHTWFVSEGKIGNSAGFWQAWPNWRRMSMCKSCHVTKAFTYLAEWWVLGLQCTEGCQCTVLSIWRCGGLRSSTGLTEAPLMIWSVKAE